MADYGSCWCCAQYGLVHVPAVSTAGLCRRCGSSSPSACQNRHQKELAALGTGSSESPERAS